MTQFYNKLSENIKSSAEYAEISNKLFDSYIEKTTGDHKTLESTDVKKIITCAQIFLYSDSPETQSEGASILSMVLDTCAEDHPALIPIAHNLFSSLGHFPNIELLKNQYPNIEYDYDLQTKTELELRKEINTFDTLTFPLTDYQSSLWSDLQTRFDVITSAPTSAGKTHIILHYLVEKLHESDGAFAAIIVPTRALISEVSSKIYEIVKAQEIDDQIEVCTVPRDTEFHSKTIFVMTQERLHDLLLQGDLRFNYLFIDEAHNISDNSRGVLLHITIEQLLSSSTPKIIISMPSSNYQNSFSSIFRRIEFKRNITLRSPVQKIIMSLTPKGRNIIVERLNSDNTKTIAKGFKGARLAEIVLRFGKNQSNIIYQNRTDYCENIADDITAIVPETEESPELEEAADYVENFIHEDFSLANNLRHGVAFHYGPLPTSVRVMVEDLAKNNKIKFIVCTSTLAEGVNLPAKNLFLKNPAQWIPYQGYERIENVKINNITGRAGRMLHHFSGNIFLISPNDWDFQDYFNTEQEEEEKIPTYFKSLNQNLTEVLLTLDGFPPDDKNDQYRFYSIANKLIKELSNGDLEHTLSADELELTEEEVSTLRSAVTRSLNNLHVPTFTLEANPTIGYIQQNKLFNSLMDIDDYRNWVLPHPKSTNLWSALVRILTRLDELGIFKPSNDYTLNFISTIAVKWVQGRKLKEIVTDQISRDRIFAAQEGKNPPKINKSVRDVMKVIDSDIRFRMSNALKCYHSLLTIVLFSKGIEISNVKLHSYLEVGACDDRMIALINLGLSREAAKEIDESLPSGTIIYSAKDLIRLSSDYLSGIHNVTKREIDNLFSN